MKVSVSYLSSKFSKEETLQKIAKTSADYLHVDLMDGEFVSQKNFTIKGIIKTLDNYSKPLDIHLMVNKPLELVKELVKLKPAMITIHCEVTDVLSTINYLHEHNIKTGITLNPTTPLSAIEPYLHIIDLVLIMSVTPGAGGQKFLLESVSRLVALKSYQTKNNFLISVDGGINDVTSKLIKNYVDILVSGSYICGSSDYEERIQKLR